MVTRVDPGFTSGKIGRWAKVLWAPPPFQLPLSSPLPLDATNTAVMAVKSPGPIACLLKVTHSLGPARRTWARRLRRALLPDRAANFVRILECYCALLAACAEAPEGIWPAHLAILSIQPQPGALQMGHLNAAFGYHGLTYF